MIKAWRIVSIIIGLLLAGYFVWFANKALNLEALKHALASPRVLFSVIVAAFLYVFIIPLTAWAWQRLLIVQSESWQVLTLARFLGLAQLAKYIPGNIAQHATRAALCLRAGMSTKSLFVTAVQETILTVAASLLVGLTMLSFTPSAARFAQLPPAMLHTFIVLVVVAVIGVFFIASVRLDPDRMQGHPNRLLRLIGRFGGLPGPALTLVALIAYACNYLLVGAGLWLVGIAIGAPPSMGLATITAAFALSWTLGFLAPGAPAGLGAREAVMLLFLHGSATPEMLITFVLLARLVSMLGDGLSFGIASMWRNDIVHQR